MTARLIVFDLDGTLVDSKRDLADAVNALLAELGSARGQRGVRAGSEQGQTGVGAGSEQGQSGVGAGSEQVQARVRPGSGPSVLPEGRQTGVRAGSEHGQTGIRPGSEQRQTGIRPGSGPSVGPSLAVLPEERITGMVGEGAAVLVRRALGAAGLDPETPGALPRFLELYDDRLLNHTALYPGMADVLAQLARDAALSVLTNKPSAATEKVLAGLGVRTLFRDVFGGDTPFGRKPDPAGLLELIARAGATPATAILVGDSRVDLDTARRGGTRICLARYGFGFRFAPEDFDGAEIFIDTPSELERVLGAT